MFEKLDKKFKTYLLTEAKKKEKPLNVVTLFSGMGAPEIALKKLGIKYNILLASDIDSDAEAIYKKVHGKELIYGDNSFIPNVYDILKTIKPEIEKYKNNVDLLVAGFPCQAFSSAGLNYGFGKRSVKLVNEKTGNPIGKTFMINAKNHLAEGEKAKPNTICTLTADVKDHPAGTKVYILPDSDGTLAVETLRIVKVLQPKVAILENVSKFGAAVMDHEDIEYADSILKEESTTLTPYQSITFGKSGVADFDVEPGERGSFGTYVKKVFDKLGYDFYPMYLDPTSYTDKTIMRRPRIYMVAIRKDIANKVIPTEKGQNFIEKTEKLFGINPKNNGETDTQLVKDTVNKLMHSSNTSNFLTSRYRDQFISIIGAIGHSRFIKAVDKIVDNALKDPETKAAIFRSSGINDSYVRELAKKAHEKLEKELSMYHSYHSRRPVVIDLQNNPETLMDYYGRLVEKFIGSYFKGSFDNNLTPITQIDGDINAKESIDFNEEEDKPEDESELEEIAEAVYSASAYNKMINQTLKNILDLKSKVGAELIKIYLEKRRTNFYISTVLKNGTYPKAHGRGANATYYILRDEAGKVKAGYISPNMLLKLMGMILSRSKDPIENNELFDIMVAAAKERPNATYNKLVNRIGNSMNVHVLEKLIKALTQLKVFK